MAETQVEFVGLNEQDQLALDSFRSIHGQPTLPRDPTVAGRQHAAQNTRFLQDFAHLKKKIGPRLVTDAVVAIYSKPSSEKSTEKQHFCEACTVCISMLVCLQSCSYQHVTQSALRSRVLLEQLLIVPLCAANQLQP